MAQFAQIKHLARSLPGYRLLRAIYIELFKARSALFKGVLRALYKRKGSRDFKWRGLAIRESWDDPYCSDHWINDLSPFTTMADLVAHLHPRGAVIVDVGANIGLFSLTCSRMANTKLYAFEPVPRTFGFLKHNVESNDASNIVVNNLGLSETPGKMWIGPPVEGADSGSFAVSEAKNIAPPEAPDLFSLATFTTLDLYLRGTGIDKIDFIKIDVEGHELSVLIGAEDTLRRFYPDVLMEFSIPTLRHSGTDPQSILDLFKGLGYLGFEVSEAGLTPFLFEPHASNPNLSCDILFTHKPDFVPPHFKKS